MNEEVTKLEDALKRMPWWGWAVGGGVLLGGVYYVRKHGASTVPGQASPNAPNPVTGAMPEYATPDGLNMADLAGMPFGYYDYSAAMDGTSTTGTPSSGNTSSSTPSTPASNGTSGTPADSDGDSSNSPPPPPPSSSTPPTPSAWLGVIRDRVTSGQNAGYDRTNTGVPLRSTPDGSIIGHLGYGSNVTITGAGVTGPSNLPAGASGGSTLWYPTAQGGYVSAADLTGAPVATTATGTGHGGPDEGFGWPTWNHASAFSFEHLLTQAEDDGVVA